MLDNSSNGHVVATCRNPDGATELLELKDRFRDRLDVHRLDLTIDRTIEVCLLTGDLYAF